MASFSRSSRSRLDSCHPDLRALFHEVVKHSDCTILEGLRSAERQQELYRQGKSKLDGVSKRSKHQAASDGFSHAADVAPYPIDWNTNDAAVRLKWLDFARVVLETADKMAIVVRWGGDWNRNWDRVCDPTDDAAQRFNDWPHWELR